MLGIKDQRASGRTIGPGRDSGISSSDELRFEASDRRELYERVERTLVQQEYLSLARQDEGLVRWYLAKVTGRGRAQVTRVIGQYRAAGRGSCSGLSAAPFRDAL